MSELLDKLPELKEKMETFHKTLNIDSKRLELTELEGQMSQPGFWDSPEGAQKVVQKLQTLRSVTTSYSELFADLEDLEVLVELAEEEENQEDLEALEGDVEKLLKRVKYLELKTYFTSPNDEKNAYFSIHPGSGGTESCDWAEILYRMYTRWMERKKFQVDLLDYQPGEEAGIKKVTLHVKGPYAFGYLKAEIGVHRLMRISPFDANKRRHTSFAGVDLYPEMDDIEIDIKEDDLRIDTYRAGGAGGQHVNVTDSAVRITHIPTNIVVQCQNERSQHKNKATAMKVLKARLYQIEEEKRDQERKDLHGKKGEIAWGNKIRTYSLQPYTLVKDHRSGYETGNAQAVLEGELDELINSYLKWRAAQQSKEEVKK